MGTYPRGNRPQSPFPYCNEVMTGFEYTAAIGLLYEGELRDGLRCIEAVRARYDGKKRNPFDEAECGHHYARAMASWAAVLALTGFSYSAVTGKIQFGNPEGSNVKWFFSTGEAWGTVRITHLKKGDILAELKVIHGKLRLTEFSMKEYDTRIWKTAITLHENEDLKVELKRKSVIRGNV